MALDEVENREETSRGISARGMALDEALGLDGEPSGGTAGILAVVLLPFSSAMAARLFV
jgi:hypothetical protein